jgi:uncharacterized protein
MATLALAAGGTGTAMRLVRAVATALALSLAASAALADVWYRPPAPRRIDLAWKGKGDPRAQSYLGYLYARGSGVPQNFRESAYWFKCAAAQGNAHGQFQLGLAYDKGEGVPQNYVQSYAWLNLATAHAPRGVRYDWVRVRDAVSSKMSLAERDQAQVLSSTGPWESVCEPYPGPILR